MLHLYLVRHAIAEELPEELRFNDPLRALTAKGRRRFRRTAKAFANLGEAVDLICTSPTLRAVQTAELLAGALRRDDVQVLDELRPDAAVQPLLRRLAGIEVAAIALVGHKRLLCEVVAALAGVDADRVRLKRGTIARLDVRRVGPDGAGKPRWWLPPSRTAVTPGLPVDESAAA